MHVRCLWRFPEGGWLVLLVFPTNKQASNLTCTTRFSEGTWFSVETAQVAVHRLHRGKGIRHSALNRALPLSESLEVLVTLRMGGDSVLEAFGGDVQEVAPRCRPHRHRAGVREAEHAVFAEVAALLHFGVDAVLLVDDHLHRSLDKKEHRVAKLASLIQQVSRGERLRLELQDQSCEELGAAMFEEGDRCYQVRVEMQRNLGAERGGKFEDRGGDVSGVVESVVKE
mmetsp:Transcript_6487/g.15682  ORF Transcript_6487/g.15682 Transcript_6487/m.15682 type:complete len:227 (-) Transcript_6487:1455-2135(-)